ncbi:MAG: SH3 domain-containing protein [Candidatus Coatesbacteria bacterium]|nr:MAG: SH3 domain-containing protein [Candidatus Coatesbacteria bacterium]
MSRFTVFIVSAVCLMAVVSSHAIKADKVELRLAVALADDTPAYEDASAQDKVFLNAGDTAIVNPCESGGASGDWYRADGTCSYKYYALYEYLKAGPKLDIRPLEGVVVAGKVNVREYPSTDAKVKTTLSGGSVVTVLARTEDQKKVEGFYSNYWYRVRTAEDVTGWIFGALLGILQPSEAFDFSMEAFERDDPGAAISVLEPTYERFPDSDVYYYRGITGDVEFAPTFNLMAGYAYYLKGDMEAARSYYDAASAYGDKIARGTIKVPESYTREPRYEYLEYGAAILAGVGLGLTYVRSDPEKAAGYFARAVAKSETAGGVWYGCYDAPYLIYNLIETYELGEISDECMQALGALLPSQCSRDLAPSYFLLEYGEALEKGGDSSEAVVLYRRIVEDYPRAYLSWDCGYCYLDIPGTALWRIMRIRTRLGENPDFDAYCDRVARANDDKRIGFIAYYLAGIALEKAGDASGASERYDRAERHYGAGGLGDGDFGFYYDDLYGLLLDRRAGRADTDEEEDLFNGIEVED